MIEQANNDQCLLELLLSDARWAQQAGISGVSFFIVTERHGWSGAQPPDAIVQMLRQITRGQAPGTRTRVAGIPYERKRPAPLTNESNR